MTEPHFDIIEITELQPILAAAESWLWTDAAACGALGDDTYFPEEGNPDAAAMARCRGCPVALECLAVGLRLDMSDGERIGWWGGVGPDARGQLASLVAVPGELHDIPPLPPEPIKAARVLRDRGRTVTQIAADLSCSERTIYRYLAERAA